MKLKNIIVGAVAGIIAATGFTATASTPATVSDGSDFSIILVNGLPQIIPNNSGYVTMYALDGRSVDVYCTEVEAWKAVGWYTEPVTLVYALDGRTLIIPSADVEEYEKVGWYSEMPDVTLYNIDGTVIEIPLSDVDAYDSSWGWYREPVTRVYALDGRTLIIPAAQFDAYRKVGWYTENEYKVVKYAEPAFKSLVKKGDYYSLYFSANRAIKNGETDPIYYRYRTKAMDMWREAKGCPIGVTRPREQMIVFNEDGGMRISFDYTNVSYKPIIAFKETYDICDIFGDVLYTQTVVCGADHGNRFYLEPGNTDYGWGLTYEKNVVDYNNLDRAVYIRNYRITEVIFDDYTKWVNTSKKGINAKRKNVSSTAHTPNPVIYDNTAGKESHWVF